MHVYLTLDSLFDTRMGVLDKLFRDSKEKYYDGVYNNRITDNFKYVNTKLFDKLYNLRDNDIIRNYVRPTPCIDFVNDLIITNLEYLSGRPEELDVSVTVNLYPYTFDKDIIMSFARVIKSQLLQEVKLNIVTDPELTVEKIRDNFDFLVMYDGLKWLNKEIEKGNLSEDNHLRGVAMYTPAIMTNKVPQEVEEDVFNTLMVQLAPVIELELFSSAIMSGIID